MKSTEPIFDVLIIGAGPSGAVSAKSYVEAGFSVACFDQGEYPDYTLIRSAEPDFDLSKDRYFAWNPNRRRAPSDYPIDDRESDYAPLMWNGVGGSSVLYAAAWHRFKPSDFRVRSLDGVGDDWPLTYEELAPFYDRVDVDFSVSGVGGDTASPHFEVPLPPFPFGALEKRFIAAHERLGWHWWPGTNAIATVKNGNLQPCVRRAACMFGCFDGAKASADRTHWPKILKAGGQLYQRARVLRIETDPQGLATGITYIDRDTGQTHFQAARLVVVACNGLGTPRLLLNSASGSQPRGLANRSGLVGKRLMVHPSRRIVGFFDDFFETWQGPWGQRLYSLQFAESQAGKDFKRGAKWQLMGTGSPINAIGPYPWGGGKGSWGTNFHDSVRERFGHTAFWALIGEDLPEESNYVALDAEHPDGDGMPGVKVHYKTSENSRKQLDFNEEMAAISLREAGAYKTFTAQSARETGWHLLGTACMGLDPERSVVDGFGRCHDIPNLIICDGSAMPTSSCVNPTGTITALALRSAEHVIATARDQKVSRAHA